MHSHSHQGRPSFFTSLYPYGQCPSKCLLLPQRPHGGAAPSVSLNSHLSDGTPPTQKLKGNRRGESFVCLFVIPLQSMGVRVQCCFTSTETIRTVRDGEPKTATATSNGHLDFHTAPELFSEFSFSVALSTETTRTIRDGEPKTTTATSNGHLDFHTAPELFSELNFSVALSTETTLSQGPLGTGRPGRPS